MKVLWNLEDNLTQKSSDSYEGGDRIRMIFRKMTTKKTVCNLFLNEQKCCTCICKSDTLKKSILQQVLFLNTLMRIFEILINMLDFSNLFRLQHLHQIFCSNNTLNSHAKFGFVLVMHMQFLIMKSVIEFWGFMS